MTFIPDVRVIADGLTVDNAPSDDPRDALLGGPEGDRWLVWARNGAQVDFGAVRATVRALSESGAAIAFGDSLTAVGGDVVRRPVFDAVRLRSQDYLGDVLVLNRERCAALATDSRTAPLVAWRHELLLDAARENLGVIHAGRSLEASPRHEHALLTPQELDATRAVLQRHLDKSGGGVVHSVGSDGVHRARRNVVGKPLVSMVIPTRATRMPDGSSLVIDALASIVELTTYDAWEVVLVVDSGADPRVLDQARALLGTRLRAVSYTAPFNFSAKVNLGVAHARGEFILMLNDDVKVISESWLEALLAPAQHDGVGMVGAMLYFSDNTIQHAGHHYWLGDASHIGLDVSRGSAGPLDGFRVERRVAGVTAACALMPLHVFEEVGGLDEGLPGAFNDVDLCLKTTWAGFDIVWTPDAELYHFESKSRDASVKAFEIYRHWNRWGFRMHQPGTWPYPLDRPAREPAPSAPLGWRSEQTQAGAGGRGERQG